MPRLFTRDEAEQALPGIVPLLEEVRTLKRRHDESAESLAQTLEQTKTNGHGVDVDQTRARQEQQAAGIAINAIVARIHSLGAEVKDIEMGLIDFRSRMNGRVVYLCWKLGETNIAWWHELDTGYGSRQALD